MAVYQVLGISELLHSILGHIVSPQDLRHAALVCKQWYELVIPFLWHGDLDWNSKRVSPSFTFLLALARRSPDRFKYYLQRIRILSIAISGSNQDITGSQDEEVLNLAETSTEVWTSFNGNALFVQLWVDLEVVREARLREYVHHIHRHVQALFRPSLRVIHIGGRFTIPSLLGIVERRCPAVRVFMQPDLYLIYQPGMLKSLIENTKLEFLDLVGRPPEATIAAGEPSAVWPESGVCLRSLIIAMDEELYRLPVFLHHMPKLRSLYVAGVYDCSSAKLDDIFPCIARYQPDLEVLRLELEISGSLSCHAMRGLISISQHCSHLKTLVIQTIDSTNDPILRIAEYGLFEISAFSQIVQNLPDLQELVHEPDRHLRRVMLADLIQLCRTRPQLTVLSLNDSLVYGEEAEDEIDITTTHQPVQNHFVALHFGILVGPTVSLRLMISAIAKMTTSRIEELDYESVLALSDVFIGLLAEEVNPRITHCFPNAGPAILSANDRSEIDAALQYVLSQLSQKPDSRGLPGQPRMRIPWGYTHIHCNFGMPGYPLRDVHGRPGALDRPQRLAIQRALNLPG